MLTDTLDIDAARFATGTGWEIKPEGACKGEVCVPLPEVSPGSGTPEFDLASATDRLGMAVVADADRGLWAIGPETLGGRALVTAEAPDVVLHDLDGAEFRLADLRGRKVVLVAWAPY